jgi:hypothetical protein
VAGDEQPIALLPDILPLPRATSVLFELVQTIEIGVCREPEADVLDVIDGGRAAQIRSKDKEPVSRMNPTP